MNKITPLETKCLANMPVVLDAIVTTIDTLSEILNPQYDRIEEYLTEFFDTHKKLRCELDENWERGTVYAFTDHVTQYKKRYLLELIPALELYYCIPFSRTGKNGVSFSEKTLLRVYVYDDVDRPEFRHGMQPIEKSGQLFFHGGDR